MTAPLKLFKKEIDDRYVRENFLSIERASLDDPFRKGAFAFFTLTFAGAVATQKVPHRLGFRPLDVLQLSVASPDTTSVTWHFDSFDQTNLVLSTNGPCTIRAYVGRYGEGQ